MNELKELETELAPRKKASRKDRIKNIAIVFLAVLLVFTFFSNTIMNRSLPEVSGQYAGGGTISTSIRGTGTVTANMAYSVQIENTRQIRAVYVKSGDTVEAGPAADIKAGNASLRALAERNAVNAPIQGTSADIIKIAMIRIDKAMRSAAMRSRMVLQIHDELVFEVPEDELAEMKRMVVREMEGVIKLRVPLTVECGSGKDWLEAH